MKLAHIFEGTERSQQGTGAQPEQQQPQGRPYDVVSAELEEQADGSEVFYFDDISVTDPSDGGTDYETAVLVEVTHYDHQAPHNGSAWSVDSDVDYYGYTDVEFKVIAWVQILDEDAEVCKIVEGEVAISKNSTESIDEDLIKAIQDNQESSRYDI